MKRKNKTWKKLLFLIPAVLGVCVLLVLPHFPDLAEYGFSRGVFRIFSYAIGTITSVFPFSISEILLYAGILAVIIILILLILKRIKWRKVAQVFGWIFSCLFLLYVVMHGANFYRYDLTQLMHLPEVDSDSQLLYDVCVETAQKASELRVNLKEDEQGYFCLENGISEVLQNADKLYENLYETYPFLSDPVKRVKGVWISPLWSYTGISGIYIPFFAEANINTDAPESSLYLSAAHELAHTKGFAKEDECNFLAYLACVNSGNEQAMYSAYLFAYRYLSAELYTQNVELYQQTTSFLSDGVRRDLIQENEYWAAHSGVVQTVSNQVNDTFIKSQGQAEGTQSYNQVVRLILSYEKCQKMP